MTPTARTLAECRKRGWPAYVCEKWIQAVKRRIDAFGFGDLLVLDGQPGALLIQATGETASGNVSTRVTKIRTECADAARAWLAAGNRIQVWGWGKRGAAGKRKLWTLREVPVTLAVIDPPEEGIPF